MCMIYNYTQNIDTKKTELTLVSETTHDDAIIDFIHRSFLAKSVMIKGCDVASGECPELRRNYQSSNQSDVFIDRIFTAHLP